MTKTKTSRHADRRTLAAYASEYPEALDAARDTIKADYRAAQLAAQADMEAWDLDGIGGAELLADAMALELEYSDAQAVARAEHAAVAAGRAASHAARAAQAEQRRAERAAMRMHAARAGAGVIVEAGHVLNRDGAAHVVAVIRPTGAELLTVRGRVQRGALTGESAKLAGWNGTRVTVHPIADTAADRDKVRALADAADAASKLADAADAGRGKSESLSPERKASNAAHKRHAAAVAARAARTVQDVTDAAGIVSAVREHAPRRAGGRAASARNELIMRRAHKARRAADVAHKADRAADAVDVLLAGRSARPALLELGERGALFTGAELAAIIGRPLTPAERKAISRARKRAAAGEVVKPRGADTAAERLANSLRRK